MNPLLVSLLAARAEQAQAYALSLTDYVAEQSYLSDSGLAEELASITAGRESLAAIASLILHETRRTDGVSLNVCYAQLLADTLTNIQAAIAEDVEFIADCLN